MMYSKNIFKTTKDHIDRPEDWDDHDTYGTLVDASTI